MFRTFLFKKDYPVVFCKDCTFHTEIIPRLRAECRSSASLVKDYVTGSDKEIGIKNCYAVRAANSGYSDYPDHYCPYYKAINNQGH